MDTQQDDHLKGKRVLIFQQRGWSITIGHFLAKKLQAEGCRLAALTLKKSCHAFLVSQKEVHYESIVNNDEIMGRPKEYLGDSQYTLEEICEALNIDSVWPIVMSLRNHVRSYRDKYYYGFKQNVSDDEIVDYIKAFYKYILKIFDEFDPEVILSPNFVALPHIMMNLYASSKGIEMIAVSDSKVKGNFIFVRDYKQTTGSFIERVDELNAGTVQSQNMDRARQYIEEFRTRFIKPAYAEDPNAKKSLIKVIRQELSPYRRIYEWIIDRPIDILESTGIAPDCKTPRYILRDHYASKRYKKATDIMPYYPLEKIAKGVFFPLQVQPEESIDVAAPFFSNQIETARQVAMSLPGDYTLMVKEHPGMVGMRPPSYLEKIARTPNVKLVDYRLSSEALIRKADLIVSPNSTTIVEAAFLNKPAIQLGNMGTTQKLPNVFIHRNMTTLSGKIKEVLAHEFDLADYERRLENYVAASYDAGFSIDYFRAWLRGDKNRLDDLWNYYKREIIQVLSKSR